jgi:hypothetical protein
MALIGEIVVAIFAACFLSTLILAAIHWHDAWSYKQWAKKRESMTLDQRIAEHQG